MRKIILGILTVALIAVSASCSLAGSEINEICLVYSGGLTEDKAFVKILPPGSTSENIGVGSTKYCYKNDQRTWIAGSKDGNDTAPVEAVSNDQVRVKVDYQLYFTLNQEEDVIREFHENLGVKTMAWEEAGWIELLRQYFEPQIERSIESAALKFKWRDLYSSEETRKAFQAEVISTVKNALREVIGNDYFCGPDYTQAGDDCGDFTFTVGKPYPTNEEIVQAVEDEQKAAANTAAQEQRNLQTEAELRGKQQIVDLYGPQGALLYDAIRSGKINFMVLPNDGNVSIPAPQPQG